MRSSKNSSVLVLTAGGTGRELYELLSMDNRFCVDGFLDDKSTTQNVKGRISDWKNFRKYHFISALGSYKNMAQRNQILSAIPLERFLSYASSHAFIYPSASICSYSSIIFPYSVISANVKLGQHTFIYHHAIISHDVVIGSNTIISNHVSISGNVIIGNNSYIGNNATVKEGIKIGNKCIIASGSSVISDVPDGFIYIRPNYLIKNHYL